MENSLQIKSYLFYISFLSIIIFSLSFRIAFAQEEYIEISPWEPEDIVPIYTQFDNTKDYIISPSKLIAIKLIKVYQNKISPKSISRCPFYISCSNFAYQSVNKYGLILGISYFIDRHFYRENIFSFYYYSLRETNSGVLKIDDSFYLLGDTQK